MSEPTPLNAEERYPIEIIQGVEGFCIGLNNYRIAGPKPWGGGTVVKRWDVSLAGLGRAIPSIDAQATEIAALRAVSSQQQQRAQLAEERIAALRGALERLLPLTDEFEYTLYGPFMGGDPRDFTPDEEMCTPEEISAWETACEEWNRGEGVDREPGCQTMGDGSAVSGTGFGLGTTIRKCAEREEARRVLAGKEAQCPKCEGRGFIRTMVDGERDSEPCSFCRMSGLAGKEAHDGN